MTSTPQAEVVRVIQEANKETLIELKREQDAYVLKLIRENNEHMQKMHEKYASQMRQQALDQIDRSAVNGASHSSKKRHHDHDDQSTTDEDGGNARKSIKQEKTRPKVEPLTPIHYEPLVMSKKTVELVNRHINDIQQNRDSSNKDRVTSYDAEKSRFCFLPVNDRETEMALFYRSNGDKDWSADNCEQALVGFVSRCHADHKEGMCHRCAGTFAKLLVDPKTRREVYQETKKNACRVPPTASFTSTSSQPQISPSVKVKQEAPSTPVPSVKVKEEPPSTPPPTVTAKKSSQSIKYTDGFEEGEQARNNREWKDWGLIQEYAADGKTVKKQEFNALYDITEDGQVYLAIATGAVGGLSETWLPKEDRLESYTVKKITKADGEQKKVAFKVHIFRASKLKAIQKRFKAVNGQNLFNQVMTKEIIEALDE